MKSIMYHYIRNYNKEFPYHNYLEKKIYKKQIKNFSKLGIASNKEEIYSYNKKYILTFDDGYKDHLWVAKELKKNNCIGLFFISSLPYKKNELLDVHKTHLIIGKVGGTLALKELKKYLNKKKNNSFLNTNEKRKYKAAYVKHQDGRNKKEFKKIMNYYGDIKIKNKILNYLLKVFDIDIKAKDYYLSKNEIKYMSDIGMIIGSHTVSHALLSRLSYKEQYKEISENKDFIENLTKKKCDTFCYPYGGKISYNSNTIKILKKLKFKLAYTVKYKDISKKDFLNKPLELPRYDCNQFFS